MRSDARLERQREANERCAKMCPMFLALLVFVLLLGYWLTLPAAPEPPPAADADA